MCCRISLWCYFVPSVLGFTSRYAWVHSVDLVLCSYSVSPVFSLYLPFFCFIALFSCFKLILFPHSILFLFCFILLMIVPFFMWSFSSLFVLVVFSRVPTCYRCPHYLVCVYFVLLSPSPLSCHPSLLCVTFPHVL